MNKPRNPNPTESELIIEYLEYLLRKKKHYRYNDPIFPYDGELDISPHIKTIIEYRADCASNCA